MFENIVQIENKQVTIGVNDRSQKVEALRKLCVQLEQKSNFKEIYENIFEIKLSVTDLVYSLRFRA